MKKKFAALALSGAMAFSGLAGIVALGVSAEAGTDEKVIKAVTGGGDKGFVTETEWNTAYEHAMTGANTGSVKLATVGTNLYFRMIVADTTKFTGKDRIAYKITVGGTTADIQGNYDPWLTGSYGFGPNVQTEMAYDDATTSYVVTIGMNLGDCYALGAAVDVAFTHQVRRQAGTGDGAKPLLIAESFISAKFPKAATVPGKLLRIRRRIPLLRTVPLSRLRKALRRNLCPRPKIPI